MRTIERILLLLFSVSLSATCFAASQSGPISVDLPRGWIVAKDDGTKNQHPTIKYIPSDGRNAAVIISIAGAMRGNILEKDGLMEFHTVRCRAYLANAVEKYETHELKSTRGWGLYSTFEDPDLVGKPAKPGDYKWAAPVEMVLDKNVVLYATIFTEAQNDASFAEALEILQSLAPGETQDLGTLKTEICKDSIVLSVPNLEATLSLPKKGFKEVKEKASSSKTYFFFSRKDGLRVSGWMDRSSGYPGFADFWASDKAKIQTSSGLKFEDEKTESIGQWQAATYVIKLNGETISWDLRACCIHGDTWFDVHLSTTEKSDGLEALRKTLLSFTVAQRGPQTSPK